MNDQCTIADMTKTLMIPGSRHDYRLFFRDWLEAACLSIQNSLVIHKTDEWEKREKRYLDIVNKYGKNEQLTMAKLMAMLSDVLEQNPYQDVLGKIYMSVIGGNANAGQFFTPWNVCKLMSETLVDDAIQNADELGNISINDPACGAGLTIIAMLEAFENRGFNWQRHAKIVAGDIDSTCVHMTYLHLSLIGARAVILHQDALSLKTWGELYTPMHFLWPMTYMVA